MRYLRGILCMTAIAALAVLWSAHGSAKTPARRVQGSGFGVQEKEKEPELHHMLGARSCASTACHGSVRPDPRAADGNFIRRDEYIQWSDRDPHGRSLLTLASERSQAMIEQLSRHADREQVLANCYACHATQVTPPQGEAFYESINCEACHGPAEHWREAHYQDDWAQRSATDQKALGFRDTKTLSARAEACAACHVGAPGREVNHDLIAAGHPVLKFELAAYHDLLPKHWNDARERRATKDFELKLWDAGQKATMAAALDLTAARVKRPNWPEFAEYDCFACHQSLGDEAGTSDGLPLWNTWNFAQLKLPLADTMSASLRSVDDQTERDIAAARNALGALQPTQRDVAEIAAHWDLAAQKYLSLAAQFRNRVDAGKPWAKQERVRMSLLELRNLLRFDDGHDTPRRWSPEEREHLIELLTSLEQDIQ